MLKIYLQEHRVHQRDAPFTHTTRIPKGKYQFEGEDLDNFFTAYCNAIAKDEKYTITERPGAYTPFRMDFDFESKLEDGTNRQYTIEMVIELIGMIQSIIRSTLNEELSVDEIEKIMTCILLEKNAPRREETFIKDGFHLHFPFFITEPNVFEYIREELLHKLIEQKFWSTHECKFTKTDKQIIDSDIGTKVWFMYGSCKSPTAQPYLITHIYDANLDELSLEDVWGIKGLGGKKFMKGRKNPVKYYLPRFLSIRGYMTCTPLNGDYKPKEVTRTPSRSHKKSSVPLKSPEKIAEDLTYIRDSGFVDMLSVERAENHDSWMDVGWTLYCIGQGCEEAFDMWVEFTKKCPERFASSRDMKRLNDEWGRMEIRGKTMASLMRMAEIDDPVRFKAWKQTNLRYLMEKSLMEKKPNETDVGRVVCQMYQDKFKCVNARSTTGDWMVFGDEEGGKHRWQVSEDAGALRRKMIEEVTERYYEFKADVVNQQKSIPEEERGRLELKQKKIENIITELKTDRFHSKLIRFCKLYMFDKQFYKKADENTNLFCFENGVFDLELGVFREGRPDDYCTMCCGQEFHEYTEEDDEVLEFKAMFDRIFYGEPETGLFLLSMMCMAISGMNKLKRFVCCTGETNAGKSIFFRLCSYAFGEGKEGYCFKLPRERVVLGPMRNTSGPAPEIARSKGKRLCVVSEVAKTEKLDIGFIKEMTSGVDTIYARTHHAEGEEINPHWTLFMQCNELPKIPGNDAPTWERVRVVYFGSHFVQDPAKIPKSEKLQRKKRIFPMDLELPSRLPDMAPVFLWYLLRIVYPKFKAGEIETPESVIRHTREYQMENDIFAQFCDEKLVKVVEDEENKSKTKKKEKTEIPHIRLVEAYTEFKAWFVSNYPGFKEKIGKSAFKTEMNKRLGMIGKKNSWWGWKFTLDEDTVLAKDDGFSKD